jgi:hypothetical protein
MNASAHAASSNATNIRPAVLVTSTGTGIGPTNKKVKVKKIRKRPLNVPPVPRLAASSIRQTLQRETNSNKENKKPSNTNINSATTTIGGENKGETKKSASDALHDMEAMFAAPSSTAAGGASSSSVGGVADDGDNDDKPERCVCMRLSLTRPSTTDIALPTHSRRPLWLRNDASKKRPQLSRLEKKTRKTHRKQICWCGNGLKKGEKPKKDTKATTSTATTTNDMKLDEDKPKEKTPAELVISSDSIQLNCRHSCHHHDA